MPSSRAISAIGRPLVRTSSTASRLNSGVNCRLLLRCCSGIWTASSHRRCPATGGKSSVHADDRLVIGQVRLGLLVDVAKLRVPVGVLGALLGLERALQRVALLLEQPSDGVVGDWKPLRDKRVGELAGGL